MKHSQQTKDRCYQLRAAGAGFKDIARVCNITEKTASTWCKENPDEIIKWLNDDEREFIYFHRNLLATKVERIDDLARKLMDRLHRDEVGMGMMPYEKAAKLFINLTNTSTKLMHIGIPKEATFPVKMRQTHITYQQLTRTQLAQQKAARQQKKTSQNPTSPGAPLCKRRKAPNSTAAPTTSDACQPREASWTAVVPDNFSPLPNPPTLTGNSTPAQTPKPTKNPNKPAVSSVQPRETKPKKPVTPTAPGSPLSKRPKPHNPRADVSTPNAQLPREASLDSAGPRRPVSLTTETESSVSQAPSNSPSFAPISGCPPQPLTEAEIAYIENSPDDPTPEEQAKIISIFDKLTAYYQHLADQEDNSN